MAVPGSVILFLISILMVFACTNCSEKDKLNDKVEEVLQLSAFPGSGGGGAVSVGGRGGVVYEVTNLNDDGAGSLRYGIEMSGARTIVFRVGGTIQLNSGLEITNPYITIAGQTAPGGGIQISGKNTSQSVIYVNTHDVIIRYLRLRHGYNAASDQDGDDISVRPGYNVVIDHCTLMWPMDENTDLWTYGVSPGIYRVVWSWNIMAEPFTTHPTTMLLGGTRANDMTDIDIHHNLLANSSHRNPLAKQKEMRFVNNIVYNWVRRASHTAGGVNADFIGNLYKPGPLLANPNGREISVFPYSTGLGDCASGSPSIYVLGNKGPFNPNPANDNWVMVGEIGDNENGYVGGCIEMGAGTPLNIGQLSVNYRRTTPLPDLTIPITIDPVDNLETVILPTVGASQRLDNLGNWVSNRDADDIRIINEYNSGTGIVPQDENSVGGFPVIAGGTPYTDTDHDGMPDDWEIAHGLNPNNAADRNDTTVMRPYTNLEAYLSGLNGSSKSNSRNKNK